MTGLHFFTTLNIGWLNAWIPSFLMIIIHIAFSLIYKEGGKRAVDTSWYTSKDKYNALGSFFFQMLILFLSLFVPLKIGTIWFFTGTIVYLFSLIAFIAAFYAYMLAPRDKVITNGIYRVSRNPMYFSFNLAMIAICIASASLWIFLLLIPFVITTHFVILGEERYCAVSYGESYLKYKKETARYFLFV